MPSARLISGVRTAEGVALELVDDRQQPERDERVHAEPVSGKRLAQRRRPVAHLTRHPELATRLRPHLIASALDRLAEFFRRSHRTPTSEWSELAA